MYSRLAILLFFVMVACIGTRVGAQQTTPATGPMPSPPSELTPRPLPPPVPPPPPQLTPPSTPPPSTPPETSTPLTFPDQLPSLHIAMPGHPVGGIPHDEALKIYARHVNELRQLPGVYSVSFSAEGLVIETNSPAVLPPDVEGLPIIPIPYGAYAASPRAPAVSPKPVPEPQEPEADCPPQSHFDTIVGRCIRDVPGPELTPGPFLPPPPGVIVLRPGKVREQAESCPDGFEEIRGENKWRFCVDPAHPEMIPPLMVPPINGIPFEEALEIHDRHQKELLQLPGVKAVGMGAEGIEVETGDPTVLPKEVEGVPIIPIPPRGPARFLNHSSFNQIRPLHGAVAVGDESEPGSFGTLTGVTLSQGQHWLIFPSHLTLFCLGDPPCPSPLLGGSIDTLNQCPHQQNPLTPVMIQPPNNQIEMVGIVQRWTPLDPDDPPHSSEPRPDLAAAFMDNNSVERDGSLLANRLVERGQSEGPVIFTGSFVVPMVHSIVTVRSSISSAPLSHSYKVKIDSIHQTVLGVSGAACVLGAGATVSLSDQTLFTVQSPFVTQPGDSGAPIFDDNGNLLGMVNGSNASGINAFGTGADAMIPYLRFDTWYGTNTTDLSVQVYPAFHSVVAGQGACAWAYIKNTGTVTANSVAIQNATTYSPQPTFNYQNPAGLWNIPYDIPAGQTATFAVCLNLNQTQIPILWILNFYGTNAAAPVIKFAYNNLATRWSSTATPDPAITTATLSNDDVVHTGGPSGTGAFSLTTVNGGASGAVTITLDTDDGDGQLLPYTLWVCETNAQAQCISSILPSLSLQMNANDVHYFSVFAQGQGQAVALDPYYNRIYCRIREGFNTPTGTLVGAAGLSITTT